jgi:cell division protein FtsA
MANNYICTLDIGSSKIAACVAQIQRKQIINIYSATLPSKGIKRGSIVDSIELVDCVGRVLKNLKNKSDINIKSIHANISGQDIVTKHSRAILPLADRGNKLITSTDIEKVNEQALILGSSIDDEVIHEVPYSYTVDSKSEISNPVGLYGHKLEVDLYLICGKLSAVQTFTHVINQAGYEIKELFFSGLATSEIVFNDELKRGTSIICDIGSDITELLLFKNGLIKDIRILSVGGGDLTGALADSLNIPFDLAEDIKVSYGVIGDSSLIDEGKEALIKKDNIYKPMKQRLISEIITSKTKSMCEVLKGEVEKSVHLSEINNFILTGRTMLQDGFLEMLETILGISVESGRISEPQILPFLNKNPDLSGRKYLNYLISLGLICKELYGYQSKTLSIKQPAKNPILKFTSKVKELYQEYF